MTDHRLRQAAKFNLPFQRQVAMRGVGFFVGAGIPTGPRVNTFTECGSCGAYHRTDFHGDCREDPERFADIPAGGEEVFEDEAICPGCFTMRDGDGCCETPGCDGGEDA